MFHIEEEEVYNLCIKIDFYYHKGRSLRDIPNIEVFDSQDLYQQDISLSIRNQSNIWTMLMNHK